MPVLRTIDVKPRDGQVALVDQTWQDYPEWGPGDEAVAYRADSLIDSDSPPYPGFAVATQPESRDGQATTVTVELWVTDRPVGLRLIHESVLAVGRAGVGIGNSWFPMPTVSVPTGHWAIEIWTDADQPRDISRVVFVLPDLPAYLPVRHNSTPGRRARRARR